MKRARSPSAWAVACGATLLIAICLPPSAPPWLFWTFMALSCAAAAAWGLLTAEDTDSAPD